jgi:hypothetical protein
LQAAAEPNGLARHDLQAIQRTPAEMLASTKKLA